MFHFHTRFISKNHLKNCTSTVRQSYADHYIIKRKCIILSEVWCTESGYTSEFVTHGECDNKPTIIIPAQEHAPSASAVLYCTETEAHV